MQISYFCFNEDSKNFEIISEYVSNEQLESSYDVKEVSFKEKTLSPKAVYPSHGIVLGGTHILEKTLKHRELREAQIKKMHESGLNEQQMLERIYFDLPQKLHKYALANINSHLLKLKGENKL